MPAHAMTLEEIRTNPETRVELMAERDGWVMVRRPGFKPFVMKAENFRSLPKWQPAKADDGDG